MGSTSSSTEGGWSGRPFRFAVGDPGTAAAVEGEPGWMADAVPDTVADAGEVGALVVRAASVRGAGHRWEGTPRQDEFALRVAAGHLVVAVADGVSAGERSHVAARLAARTAVDRVAELLELGEEPGRLAWDVIVGELAALVVRRARREQGDPSIDARAAARSMATTLAVAVLACEPGAGGEADGEADAGESGGPAAHRVDVAVVGDPSAWRLRAGAWEPLVGGKVEVEGAPSSSATVALPLLPPSVAAVSTALHPGELLAVMTDGVGDPLGDGSGAVGTALAEWWGSPPDRHDFTAQVDFARRSHTDDRTVVAVWVPPADTAADDGATTAGGDGDELRQGDDGTAREG